jgi:predicted metal-binding membrane protein
MSMMWSPMPGQTWPGIAASFVGMWMAMTAAMMLPSLVPVLWRYRRSVGGVAAGDRDVLTAIIALAYFLVWTMLGAVVFAVGAALAAMKIRQPSLAGLASIALGVTLLIAGLLQCSTWKARSLACFRVGADGERASPLDACRRGLRLGLHCAVSCSALMAIQLAAGIMDLRVMAIVTAAITAERLAPRGERIARLTGSAAVVVGVAAIARAAGLG